MYFSVYVAIKTIAPSVGIYGIRMDCFRKCFHKLYYTFGVTISGLGIPGLYSLLASLSLA